MTVKPYLQGALLCLCLFGATALAQTVNPTPAPTPGKQTAQADDSTYAQLVERAKKGDTNVDFVKLREAFSAWLNDEKRTTDAPGREAMVEAFKKKDLTKAVELAETVLDYEFVNRGLHVAAEQAYRQLGNEARANFHRDIAAKLLQALLSAGDGKSPETAYRVLSIAEEYFIMRQLGYQVSSQSLLAVKDKPYDLLAGTDPKTGKAVEVYFDISSFFGNYGKSKK